MQVDCRRIRSALYIVLLFALMARSMIPVGFMPDLGKGGLMRLVICTGEGHSTITVDAAKYAIPAKHDTGHTGHGDVCPFAAVGAVDTVHPVAVLMPAATFQKLHPMFLAADIPQARIGKPWLSQGPPDFLTQT